MVSLQNLKYCAYDEFSALKFKFSSIFMIDWFQRHVRLFRIIL